MAYILYDIKKVEIALDSRISFGIICAVSANQIVPTGMVGM